MFNSNGHCFVRNKPLPFSASYYVCLNCNEKVIMDIDGKFISYIFGAVILTCEEQIIKNIIE